MKIFLITVVLAGVLLLAALPNVTGTAAEEAVYKFAAHLNSDPAREGQFQILSYQRGYRTTESIFSWMPPRSYAALAGEQVQVSCEGMHGVLSFDYQCQLSQHQRYLDFVAEDLDGDDPLAVVGTVSIFGDITHSMELNEFAFQQQPGRMVSVEPGVITFTGHLSSDYVDVEGELQGLDVDSSETVLSVTDVAIDGRFHLKSANSLIGELNLVAEEVQHKRRVGAEMRLGGLTLQAASSEQDENFGIDYRSNVKTLAGINHAEPGQAQIELQNMQIGFRMDGIDKVQFSQLMGKVFKLMEDSRSPAPNYDRNAAMLGMLPEFEAILKPGLKTNAEFSADILDTKAEAKLSLDLLGSYSLGDLILLRVNPRGVFAKAEASFDSTLPKILVDSHPQLSGMVTSSQWYHGSGSNYASDFLLHEGNAILNGRELSIEEMLTLIGRPPRKRRGGF